MHRPGLLSALFGRPRRPVEGCDDRVTVTGLSIRNPEAFNIMLITKGGRMDQPGARC